MTRGTRIIVFAQTTPIESRVYSTYPLLVGWETTCWSVERNRIYLHGQTRYGKDPSPRTIHTHIFPEEFSLFCSLAHVTIRRPKRPRYKSNGHSLSSFEWAALSDLRRHGDEYISSVSCPGSNLSPLPRWQVRQGQSCWSHSQSSLFGLAVTELSGGTKKILDGTHCVSSVQDRYPGNIACVLAVGYWQLIFFRVDK